MIDIPLYKPSKKPGKSTKDSIADYLRECAQCLHKHADEFVASAEYLSADDAFTIVVTIDSDDIPTIDFRYKAMLLE